MDAAVRRGGEHREAARRTGRGKGGGTLVILDQHVSGHMQELFSAFD